MILKSFSINKDLSQNIIVQLATIKYFCMLKLFTLIAHNYIFFM